MDFGLEKRIELPSIGEVFYAKPEPTYILNTMGAIQRRHPVGEPIYRTQALVAPTSTQTHIAPSARQGLELSVPMCCEKCVTKVRRALEDMEGVRSVLCDQYAQRVVVSGTVDPETVLRRVRRVKKKSYFWKLATQPIRYSSSNESSSKPLAPAAAVYHTSAYQAPSNSRPYSSPYIDSAYSRPYSSPYIDSAYRSGYVESRNRVYHDELLHSRFDRGTPYLQMDDAY